MRITPAAVASVVIVAALWAPRVDTSDDLALIDVVKRQAHDQVRALLAQSVDVNARQPDGATALHWAAYRDDVLTAILLVDAGAQVDAANDFGITPLSLACTNASMAMVTLLLEAGADASAATLMGETALMTAARTGNLGIVEALLARGIDVNATERSRGQTALMWSASEGHAALARALIAHGADVHARSTGGFTPLLFAAREGAINTARLLVDAGAEVDAATPDGTTSLVVATVRGHTPVALWLLRRGADANAAGAGFTALHWVAGSWETEVTGPLGFTIERHDEWRALRGVPSGRLELATALLSHGADPNARLVTAPPRAGFSATDMRRLQGATPFWLAAMAADVDMLRRLAEHGGDPTLATTHDSAPPSAAARPRIHRDTTPLMVAAGVARNLAESMVTNEEALAAVKLLAELGGDVNVANTAGDTALHGAAHTRSDALVQFLVDEGAGVSAANALGETPLIVAERYIHPGGAPVIARTSTGDLLRALGAR